MILAGNVVPVKPEAAAGTVISAVPSNETPLMERDVARAVAVPELPVTLPAIGALTVRPVNVPTEVIAGWAAVVTVPAVVAAVAFVALVAVAAFPVILPAIGFVTVRSVNVPTEVKDEFTMVAGSVVPVNPEAAAGTVIFAVPSNATPLIVLDVAKAVAVPALPVTLPEIGAETVKPVNVPTEVIVG